MHCRWTLTSTSRHHSIDAHNVLHSAFLISHVSHIFHHPSGSQFCPYFRIVVSIVTILPLVFLLGSYTHVVCKAHEWHGIAETYMRASDFYCIWDVWFTADGCFLQRSPPACDRRAQRRLFCIHTNGTLFSSTCPRLDSVLLPQNDLCSKTTENLDLL